MFGSMIILLDRPTYSIQLQQRKESYPLQSVSENDDESVAVPFSSILYISLRIGVSQRSVCTVETSLVSSRQLLLLLHC